MRNITASKVILFIAGLVAAAVGGANLFVPAEFHATTGITLGDNISLLNEVRASGGALLAGGILILAGAFRAQLAYISASVATLIYFGYGLSRLFSMAIDGTPHTSLVQAAALEIIVGLACLYALKSTQTQQTRMV